MKKMILETDSYLDDMGLEEYLLTVKGIKEVIINKNKIIIDYDSELISLKVIKLEINLFIGVNDSRILTFNKDFDNKFDENEYIREVCCDNCLSHLIDDLLEVEGIEKVDTEFLTDTCVKLIIGYNKDKIGWDKICKILKDSYY